MTKTEFSPTSLALAKMTAVIRIQGFEQYLVTKTGFIMTAPGTDETNPGLEIVPVCFHCGDISVLLGSAGEYKGVANILARAYLPRPISDEALFEHEVGFKDNNRNNYQLSNLVWVKKSETSRCRVKYASKTNYLGVTRVKSGKYQAKIQINGFKQTICTFAKEQDAGNAYIDRLNAVQYPKVMARYGCPYIPANYV
jgi:hypothetical protein